MKEEFELFLKAFIYGTDSNTKKSIIKYLSENIKDLKLIDKYKDILNWDILVNRTDLGNRREFLLKYSNLINWNRYFPKTEEEIEYTENNISETNWVNLGISYSRECNKNELPNYNFFRKYGKHHKNIWNGSVFSFVEDYNFLIEKREDYEIPYSIFIRKNDNISDTEIYYKFKELLIIHPNYITSLFNSYDSSFYFHLLISNNHIKLLTNFIKDFIDFSKKLFIREDKIWNKILIYLFEDWVDYRKNPYLISTLNKNGVDIPWEIITPKLNIKCISLLNSTEDFKLYEYIKIDILDSIKNESIIYSENEAELVEKFIIKLIDKGYINHFNVKEFKDSFHRNTYIDKSINWAKYKNRINKKLNKINKKDSTFKSIISWIFQKKN